MKLEKSFISFRIGTGQWLPQERFDELMALFSKYKNVTDEITFFTSETHAPLPLVEIQRRADILSERMKSARQFGYKTGVNVLATIGHHEENLPNSLHGNYTHLTDIDGKISQGTYCPNDVKFCEEYVKPLYEMITNSNPDYIWVDDDVRLRGHKPIMNTCFCDNCLKIFNKETGKNFSSREELKSAFNHGTSEERIEIRNAWLRHNSKTIGNFLELIEHTIHSIAPGMPIGFMDGSRFYEGYDLPGWAETLSGSDHSPVLWRPGGGTYTDECLDRIFNKANVMGYEAASLPDNVTCIESELESFSYQRLKKSEQYTLLEAACYIAAGCTGTAFNVLSLNDEPLDEYESLMGRIAEGRPFLDLLVKNLSGKSPAGIGLAWNRDLFAAKNLTGDWFDETGGLPGFCNADEIFKIGLPTAYKMDHANVIALSGHAVSVMDDGQIRNVLSRGVYMDGEALDLLNKRGFQELTGFVADNITNIDNIERLSEHSLNDGFAGRCRNGRQSFWPCPAYSLTPTSEKAEILAAGVDYNYQETAKCVAGVFENSLGGRICVAGYYPWEQLQYLFKTIQLKRIMRWLSKDTLGAYIESYHRITLWDRISDDDQHSTVLVNASLDPSKNVELLLRTESQRIKITDMYSCESEIQTISTNSRYRKVVIPTLQPWHIYLVNT